MKKFFSLILTAVLVMSLVACGSKSTDETSQNGSEQKQNTKFGVPVVAQWLMNPTRHHEVAGLIPGLAQWVKNLALP